MSTHPTSTNRPPLLPVEAPTDDWSLDHPYCPTDVFVGPDGEVGCPPEQAVLLIHKTPVGGGDTYTAWEPEVAGLPDHCTISYCQGRWWGRIGTRRLNSDEDRRMGPIGSDERIAAVRAWYGAEYARATEVIRSVYDDARDLKDGGMGELRIAW